MSEVLFKKHLDLLKDFELNGYPHLKNFFLNLEDVTPLGREEPLKALDKYNAAFKKYFIDKLNTKKISSGFWNADRTEHKTFFYERHGIDGLIQTKIRLKVPAENYDDYIDE